MIKEATTAASITAEIDHLRGLISWKTVADIVFLWALAVAGIAAIVVFVCTFLSMRWGDEITDLKDRNSAREIAKARADGIAEGTKAGAAAFSAGERAGQAQADVDAAKVEIAKQKTLTAQAQLETERIKAQVAWRDVTEVERLAILDALKIRPAGALNIQYVPQDNESLWYARRIAEIFEKAGWKVAIGIAGQGAEIPTGLIFPAEYVSAESISVRSAFSAAKIPLGSVLPPVSMNLGSPSYVGAPTLTVGSRNAPKL